ncbi:MAG: DUF4330 domain-containing protein [Clostridia bacterium]|nr:DUF4330 domain-containing protein [Clostridia bacterium]
MKLIDKKGRIGGKFSIVDLFVILLVIACISAVGLKLKKAESVSGGDRVIVYKVFIENVRDVSVDAINSNLENITDAESKKVIGTITDIEVMPARVLSQKNDGSFVMTQYENRNDLILTVKAQGTETDDAYYTSSGRQIMAGEIININNGYSQSYGEVISVDVE